MAGTIRAEWSTTYLSQGYEVTISFSGEDLEEVMAEGKALLVKMCKKGIVPVRTRPDFPGPHRRIKRVG